LFLTPENVANVEVVKVLKVGLCGLKVVSDKLTEAVYFPASSKP